ALTSGGKPTLATNAKPEDEAEQPEFLVEKITGKRYWNGRPQVQIKWQGYPPEENTWEPMENIGNCMVLLADFEAELYKRKTAAKRGGGKKCDGMLLSTTHPGDAATRMKRRVEIAMEPRENLTNRAKWSVPKPNASRKAVAKSHKLDPAQSIILSESSDDEVLLKPSSSFYKRRLSQSTSAKPSTSAAVPLSSSDDDTMNVKVVRSESSLSESSDDHSRLLRKMPTLKAAKETNALKPQKEAGKDVASIKTKKTPTTLNHAVSKITKKNQEKGEIKESDNDSDIPLEPPHTRPSAKRSDWKLPLRKAPFGLARGLKLKKIVHNFKVADKLFLFVNWKGFSGTDVVPMEELRTLYPAEVIEYFESMKRSTKK
ncbi:hypothetical protein KR032_007885, partial [Drosophila birchii]